MADDVGARYMEDLNSLMGANMGKYSTLKRRQSKSHLARKDTSTRTEISGKSSLVSEHSVAHVERSHSAPTNVHALASLSFAMKPTMISSKSLVGTSAQKAVQDSLASPPISKPLSESRKAASATNGVLPSEKQSGKVLQVPVSLERTQRPIGNDASVFPQVGRRGIEEGSRPPPNGVAAQRRCSILWLRNDLRVHDHEVLCRANSESASMVPVFCFDPRDFGKTSSGFDKTGPYRAKFLIECVADLRKHLKQLGSDLVIRIGRPEEVLPQLVRETGAEAVMSHAEITVEEVQSEEDVRSALKEHDAELKLLWGSTLYHLDDLPFRLENMPSTYGAFRASVQDKVSVRTALKTPSELKGFPTGSNIEVGDIPTLQSLGLSSSSAQEQQEEPAAAITGGESEALSRLKSFVAETKDRLSTSDRGGSEGRSGGNFSCKISPWLAMGCLSARQMFEEIRTSVSGKGGSVEKNKATTETAVNWLVFELLWRDFFRFISKKYGTMHQQKEQQTRQPLPCA
ncbi:1,3-beta-glucanosyltransferase, variant 2 [Cymbomonas tetramitiformis]|uniref:1,3-beta-glucanosyltransferase, variant 2 n=1 Tax=Cymbomonas tetramitiformis TaxID=36881 RepID=A0AAE0BJI2_9CHLO|nr:1,3-beta-glucanosyltransferase, variant 2 [Cymbomonas tetramitiformis]